MNEECLRAQEAISHAADGDRVSAEEAAFAKRHCAGCTECTEHVRTLAHLRTVPTPAAPEETVARIVAAGTALIEADRRAVKASAAEAAAALSSADDETGPRPDDGASRGAEFAEVPAETHRRASVASVVGWAAGIAAVLFVAMIVTAQGLRSINNPATTDVSDDSATRHTTVQEDLLEQQSPEAGASAQMETALEAPGYIVFDGSVYQFSGIVNEDVADYTDVGRSRTALDTGGTPQQRTVYGSDTDERVYIEGNGVYAFVPVTRLFEEATFVLRGDPVEEFGQWPPFPSSLPEPTNVSGSIVFKEAGQSQGVPIYTRTGRDPEEGFALAPNSPQSDPARGNPDWTWWELQDD